MPSLASGSLADAVLTHAQRVRVLERLSRRIQTVRHVRVGRIHPVKLGSRAHAASNGFVVRKFGAGPRINSADGEIVHGALAGRGNAFGKSAGEGFEDGINYTLRGFDVAAGDGGRMTSIDDGPFRRDDFD